MLVIAIACVAGAVVTWFFIPTIQVGGASTGTVEEKQAEPEGPRLIKTPMMSESKRRTRAEQLVGDDLRYATGKSIRSVDWFKEQSMQTIERAMDECFLVLDPMLYAQHVQERRDEDIDSGKVTMKDLFPRPNLRQVMACKNVMVAYLELHGKKIDF
jgi:hypothetical protein